MKTDKKSLIMLLATWVLSIFIITWVSAYKWDPTVQGPSYTPERHEDMLNAFETNDYDAWSNLMEWKWRVTEVINEDNFSKFVEAHNLALQGDLEWSKEIREELGLWLWQWKWNKQWRWRWQGMWNWNRWANNGNCVYNNQ
jgi:hypothetical protein